MKRAVNIGVLFSCSGMYAAMSRASLDGTLLGVQEVNADPNNTLTFNVIERDPEGRLDRYAPLCREMLREFDVKHIFGCITSASRKEVIPELERFDGILWYMVPYEGFEASERVAYMHSCPNQHLLPLLDWSLENLGKRAYLAGSNYIWGWEMARIARERVAASGGLVLGDRYVAVGDVDIDHIVAEIIRLKPNFILNSLIGESSYVFLSTLRDARQKHGLTDELPVLSCNFTECEIGAAGAAAEGLIAAGPWFASDIGHPGSFHEIARQSVHELASLLQTHENAQQCSLAELISVAAGADYISRINPSHLHANRPVKIVQLEGKRFVTLAEHGERVADPYLTHKTALAQSRPRLRVVS